jgi:hypothetical protein
MVLQPVIATLGKLRQEDGELVANLSYTERPCLTKIKIIITPSPQKDKCVRQKFEKHPLSLPKVSRSNTSAKNLCRWN